MNDVETTRPARVFLSYAPEDKETARHIASALKRSGVSTWFDEWELSPGDSITNRIAEVVASSDYVVVLLSPASVSSRWIQAEWSSALSSELTDRAIRVLPVLIGDCDVPPLLANLRYLDLRGNFDSGVQRLVTQLSVAPSIQFSNLTPQHLESLVGDLLLELGFSVEAQMARHDQGFDFKASYKSRDPFGVEKTEVWLVEAKLYRNSRVSIGALREALGLLSGWPDVTMALIVTSGNITSEARRFLAETKSGSKVRIIEGPELTDLIARYPVLIERHFPHGGGRA
jgi:hypothetical protein